MHTCFKASSYSSKYIKTFICLLYFTKTEKEIFPETNVEDIF